MSPHAQKQPAPSQPNQPDQADQADQADQYDQPAPTNALLFLAFFVSGMAALIAETIWTRSLLLTLGTTATAVGVVLAAFMGGMGVGAALVARHRRLLAADPLMAFVGIEAFTGLYVLISPALLSLSGKVPFQASQAFQHATALLILLPATMAMGATLPLLSRAARSSQSPQASLVGRLYAANTIGAVIGPLVSVFFLFPRLGLRSSLLVASALFFLSAGIGVVFFLRRRGSVGLVAADPYPLEAGTQQAHPGSTIVGVALAVSGATAMVYQVVWSRLLSMVFGSSVYGVSLTLSAFLFGLAGGTIGASWWIRRRSSSVPMLRVAHALMASAALAFLSLLVARSLPLTFLNLYASTEGSDGALFLSQFVIAMALMLPSTLALGATFPLAVSAVCSRSSADQSAQIKVPNASLQHIVGRLYSFNLFGSMLGAIAGSTLLLASLGVEFSLRVSALTALLFALVLVIKAGRFSVFSASAATATALLVLALDPSGERVVKSFGVYAEADVYSSFEPRLLRETIAAHRLLFYRDGPTATVAVQQIDRFKLLKINGKTDASNGPGDVETQLQLAHIPMLLREAKDVAVIGWGSGTTAGALLDYDVTHVDAFEIEPAVVEASRFFEPENGKPLEDARLELHLGDARQRLQRNSSRYDLIISEPSNPWLTGVANLFTLEFFQILRSRLTEDGLVCQWFHLYGMSEQATQSIIATFRSVFPHAIALGDRDLILIGSREPIRISLTRLKRLFQDPELKPSLSRAGMNYPADLLVELQLDEQGTKAFSDGGTINTDINLHLELSAPKTLYQNHVGTIRASMRSHRPDRTALALSETDASSEIASNFELELAASLFTAQRPDEALRHTERALELDKSFDAHKLHGQVLNQLGRKTEARTALEAALAVGGDSSSRRFVEAMIRSLDAPTGG